MEDTAGTVCAAAGAVALVSVAGMGEARPAGTEGSSMAEPEGCIAEGIAVAAVENSVVVDEVVTADEAVVVVVAAVVGSVVVAVEEVVEVGIVARGIAGGRIGVEEWENVLEGLGIVLQVAAVAVAVAVGDEDIVAVDGGTAGSVEDSDHGLVELSVDSLLHMVEKLHCCCWGHRATDDEELQLENS